MATLISDFFENNSEFMKNVHINLNFNYNLDMNENAFLENE